MRSNTVFTRVNFVNEAGAPENECFYRPSEKVFSRRQNYNIFKTLFFASTKSSFLSKMHIQRLSRMLKNRAFLRSRPLKSALDCKHTWFLFTGMRCNTVFTKVNFVNEAGATENECFYKPSEKVFSRRQNYNFFKTLFFASTKSSILSKINITRLSQYSKTGRF